MIQEQDVIESIVEDERFAWGGLQERWKKILELASTCHKKSEPLFESDPSHVAHFSDQIRRVRIVASGFRTFTQHTSEEPDSEPDPSESESEPEPEDSGSESDE